MLDLFYVSSRYPDALGGATAALTFIHSQAQQALSLASLVVSFARNNLPPQFAV